MARLPTPSIYLHLASYILCKIQPYSTRVCGGVSWRVCLQKRNASELEYLPTENLRRTICYGPQIWFGSGEYTFDVAKTFVKQGKEQ